MSKSDEYITKVNGKDNAKLLTEIRERYEYANNQWRDIRKEAELDMRYLTGDPWEPDAKKEREDAGRPMLVLDELNQYVNQGINTYRQNKRGIKINPAGGGATDKTAEYWENRVRAIEVRSNAQQSAYIPAFQSALERSYGFYRVSRRYLKGLSFDQEIILCGITNPDTVTPDPDPKEADWSDAEYYFVADPVTKTEFKRRWPKAKIVDFPSELQADAPDWIREDHVVVAEYWKRVHKERTLVLYKQKGEQKVGFADEIEGKHEILKEREYDDISLTQYNTNGVEILDSTKQPGTIIPIIPVIGKEMWLTVNGRAKRIILSLIRLARDPQMLYNFLASQEAEEATMSPKAPFVGAKGQFESDQEAWESLHKVPRAYVQYDPMVDQTSTPLPPPSRPQFVPNFQTYEVAKEAAKRAIQAAVGINPLPTPAQKQNQKSGIALERIQTQEALGAFHFTDNADRALQMAGRIIMEWGPVVDDTEREVPMVKKDGTASTVKINTAKPYQENGGDPQHYPVVDDEGEKIGEHDVVVSTGPSYQSQHEEAASFIDSLVGSPLFPLVADLAVKMRNLGPEGDEMAERLTPPQFAKQGSPQEAASKLMQSQQQMQQLQAELQAAQTKLGELEMQRQGKVIEMHGKAQLQQQEAVVRMSEADKDRETKIAVAEISTKAQILSERVAAVEDMMKQFHQQAHDVAMQGQQQAHEQDMAQQQAAQAQQQQATQIQADQAQQQPQV